MYIYVCIYLCMFVCVCVLVAICVNVHVCMLVKICQVRCWKDVHRRYRKVFFVVIHFLL